MPRRLTGDREMSDRDPTLTHTWWRTPGNPRVLESLPEGWQIFKIPGAEYELHRDADPRPEPMARHLDWMALAEIADRNTPREAFK